MVQGRAVVTLELPERLSLGAVDSLIERVHATREDVAVRVVVLRGARGVFCCGMDLAEAASLEGSASGPLRRFDDLLRLLETCPRPVISVVEGAALGGGAGIAAVSDVVLASPDATFGLPEAILGVIPAVVFSRVARRIGVPRARLLALEGGSIGALDAKAWGFVDELADEDVDATLEKRVSRLLRGEPGAQAAIKRLMGQSVDEAIETFASLFASLGARRRLERQLAGEFSWQEDER